MSVLGIIAGAGDLPRAVAESARADGRKVFVVSLTGDANDWTAQFSREEVSLGEMGKALRALAANHCTDVLFAGRVNRPRFSEIRLDTKARSSCHVWPLPLSKAMTRLLRAVVDILRRKVFAPERCRGRSVSCPA